MMMIEVTESRLLDLGLYCGHESCSGTSHVLGFNNSSMDTSVMLSGFGYLVCLKSSFSPSFL
jgi:hypothetical protein